MIITSRFILFLLLILSQSAYSQALQLSSGGERNITLDPGVINSFEVILENTSATDTIVKIEPAISNSLFQFLGGAYPGIGGDCDSSLNPNQSCSVFFETTPVSMGDIDSYLAFDYAMLRKGGAFPPPYEQTEIKIDGYALDTSYSLAPIVKSVKRDTIKINHNSTVYINGSYLTPSSNVVIPGLSVTNVVFISSQQISFDINPGTNTGFYDIIISNEIDSTTLTNALEVKENLWVDLRNPSEVALADPVFETNLINGYNINPSFGLQLDIADKDFEKALRFNGLCASINNDFDMVVYRSNTDLRAMFGLMSTTTQVNPSAGPDYDKRQYIGQWNTGGRVQKAFGSQLFETGGVDWSQGYSRVDTDAGMFIRYHFENAGQSGSTVEIWEVDSSLNDVALLVSYISNKPATPATEVCPSVIPDDEGIADYFITAIRYE